MDHLGQNLSNLSLLYRIYQANAAYISAVAAKYNILFIRSAGGKICQTQRFDIPSTFFVEFQQEEQWDFKNRRKNNFLYEIKHWFSVKQRSLFFGCKLSGENEEGYLCKLERS